MNDITLQEHLLDCISKYRANSLLGSNCRVFSQSHPSIQSLFGEDSHNNFFIKYDIIGRGGFDLGIFNISERLNSLTIEQYDSKTQQNISFSHNISQYEFNLFSQDSECSLPISLPKTTLKLFNLQNEQIISERTDLTTKLLEETEFQDIRIVMSNLKKIILTPPTYKNTMGEKIVSFREYIEKGKLHRSYIM
jgi:hypothetical protein